MKYSCHAYLEGKPLKTSLYILLHYSMKTKLIQPPPHADQPQAFSAFCLLLIFHQKQHEIRLYLFKPQVSLLCIVSMNTLIELDSAITGDKIPPFFHFFFSATSHCCCSQQSAADDIFRDITDIFICHQARSFTHLKGRLLTHSVTPV